MAATLRIARRHGESTGKLLSTTRAGWLTSTDGDAASLQNVRPTRPAERGPSVDGQNRPVRCPPTWRGFREPRRPAAWPR